MIYVGSFFITLFGAEVYQNIKLQATVSPSSNEAEFMAAVSGDKSVKYVSSIIEDMGFSRQGPIKLFCEHYQQ